MIEVAAGGNKEEEEEPSTAVTIFKDGKTDESYESDDASWLIHAADNAVITIIYACDTADHAGWGIIGWGADVDGEWKDGPGYNADSGNAAKEVTIKITAEELRKALGITEDSEVKSIKLGAWNGGRIISLTIAEGKGEPQEPEDDVAHTGSVTGTALAATDWDGIEISLSDLIGDVRPSTITAIEFTSDKPFVVGYNGSEGWQQQADGTSYSISDIVLSDNYFLKVVLTAGDDLEHTISWKVHAQDNGEPLIATLNWHGTNVKETFRLEDYLAGLTVGDQVEIEVKFESTAASWGGSLGCNDSGGWKDVEFNNSSPTAKLSFTVMYDNPTPQIQLYWADENAVVNAYLVSATKSEPVTGIAKANMLAAGGMNERNTIPSSVSGNVSDGAATVSGGDAADVDNGEDGVTTVSGNDAE